MHIYEVEGNIKPFHRSKERSAKAKPRSPIDHNDGPCSILTRELQKQMPAVLEGAERRHRATSCTQISQPTNFTPEDNNVGLDIDAVDLPVAKKQKTRWMSASLFEERLNDVAKNARIDSSVACVKAPNNETDSGASSQALPRASSFDCNQPAFSREISWGVGLTGENSYLAFQEQQKDGILAFPSLHNSYQSVENLLFPCELINSSLTKV